MPSPATLTNEQILAWLDANPHIEAAAILSGIRPLEAEEEVAAARRGPAGTVPPVQRRPEGDPAGPRVLATVPLRIEVER